MSLQFNCIEMPIKTEKDVWEAMKRNDQLAEKLGFPPTVQIMLRLALEEAAVNSLEYGRGSSHEPVHLSWNVDNHTIRISLKQKGSRFCIGKKEEVNVSSCGRGLQLILNIMDKVWLDEKEGYVIFHMQKSCH
ncbi:hypothetical protein A8F95_10565 [Bacillus wudalianchiensis]|uniref:Histidine kinase/HSP90-like ATPase domain-containing protein n=2 Tax=Pseudobacillus wudalianchiensis TaxID=1743143 RepID=A0A1B9AN97_9BACI|nr:hypothetical protein A8F95_10565 [Bacillus wudalianchiensis]